MTPILYQTSPSEFLLVICQEQESSFCLWHIICFPSFSPPSSESCVIKPRMSFSTQLYCLKVGPIDWLQLETGCKCLCQLAYQHSIPRARAAAPLRFSQTEPNHLSLSWEKQKMSQKNKSTLLPLIWDTILGSLDIFSIILPTTAAT